MPAPAQMAANRRRLSAEECSAVLISEIMSQLSLDMNGLKKQCHTTNSSDHNTDVRKNTALAIIFEGVISN